MKPRIEHAFSCSDQVRRAPHSPKRPTAVVVLAALASLGVSAAIGLVPVAASITISPPHTRARVAEATTPSPRSTEPTRSVWDGVYTEAQAKRGNRVFQTRCGDCHQVSEFGGGYSSVYEFFESRKTMPEFTPGTLSAKAYADLTAYVLEANGFPAGEEELGSDKASLETILFGPEPVPPMPD
jgi:quinoprotein glucose dehydrogenase